MFNKDKLDIFTINRMLKLLEILLVLLVIYSVTLLFNAWYIGEALITIFRILSPVFIGLFIAWLFDPLVDFMVRKGFKRFWASLLVYLLFIAVILLVVGTIIPLVGHQLAEIAQMIPAITDNSVSIISDFLDKLHISGISGLEEGITAQIENIGSRLYTTLPTASVNFVRELFGVLSNCVIGIIIGFFILVSLGNSVSTLTNLFPKKMRGDVTAVLDGIVVSFRAFLKGALIDSTVIFIASSCAFWLVGLKAPMLFGFFCAITNVIPYAGPYIGGFPAILIGFTQSPAIGVAVFVSIVVIQFIEGNFFQPLIMSYSTRLHPVVIIAGLLIFGHFFGIIGMFISTPILAAARNVLMYYDKKYQFFNYD